MKMNLAAVLIGENFALEEHLKKTGVPLVKTEPSAVWPENHAVYIFSGQWEKALTEKAEKFLAAGRFILTAESGAPGAGILAHPNVRLLPERCLFDISKAQAQSRIKFFAVGARRPKEEMAAKPRASVRHVLWGLLLEIYSAQGLYCPRLSFYPRGYRSVFSFRVDADEYEKELFGRFFEAAKKYSRAVSIFFSMANYAGVPDEIRRCHESGFDCHSHAYTHFTYKSRAQNLFNLKKADEALSAAGIPKKAFASPYGRWNEGLQSVIEERGYTFSSEFSYNYDDVPSYPVIAGRRSSVLQVPVHPVGIGVYMEAGKVYDRKEVEEYYRNLFQLKYAQGEPILFYDHPTQWLGVYPEFMDFLFGLAQEHADIWACSMSEWAAWWKKRHRLHWNVVQDADGGGFEVLTAGGPGVSEDLFEVQFFEPSGKKTAWTALRSGPSKGRFENLEWAAAPGKAVFDEGLEFKEKNVLRRAKNRLKDWLDWETSTPRGELVRESFPSRVKYALRALKTGKR